MTKLFDSSLRKTMSGMNKPLEIAGTYGEWLSILHGLGIDLRGDGKHEKCPICGRKGSKGFRFTDRKGYGEFICTHGAGNGFEIVKDVFNVDFKGALEMVRELKNLNGGKLKRIMPKEKKLMTAEEMHEMFAGAAKVQRGDIVDQYLTSRGITARPHDNLWHSARCWHSETKSNHYAMFAVWHMQDGQAVASHRTYLCADARKLEGVESNKKMSPAMIKNIMGGAVRLFELGESKILGIGEGVETCLAAAQDFKIPFWATTGAAFMAGWVPPAEVLSRIDQFILVGDNDASFTGQAATYALAKRLRVQYRKDVVPYFPDKVGCDWLDVVNGVCGCRTRG